MKSCRYFPCAVRNAAYRAWSGPTLSTSLETSPCRNVRRSAPLTARTPRSSSSTKQASAMVRQDGCGGLDVGDERRLGKPRVAGYKASGIGEMDILFVTATRIGDAVLSTGLISYLVDRHVDARLTIAAGPIAAPLFEAVPGLERLVVVQKRRWSLHWLPLYL